MCNIASLRRTLGMHIPILGIHQAYGTAQPIWDNGISVEFGGI